MKTEAIIGKAILKFGAEKQTDKAIEEMSELIQALLKYRIKEGVNELINVHEEIADVEIMIGQLRCIYGDYQIDKWKKQKIKRLEKFLNK